MVKTFDKLLDCISYKTLRRTLLILMIAYTYWGVTVFQKAGTVPWNKMEQHTMIYADGSADFRYQSMRTNRSDQPVDSFSDVSGVPIEATFTDAEGRELQVETVKENHRYHYTIHLLEPLAPGDCAVLNVEGSAKEGIQKKGDMWHYVHHPSFGKRGRVAHMVTLPENAALVSVSPEPNHMFVQHEKLTMRFYWDDPSKVHQGVKVQYKLMED